MSVRIVMQLSPNARRAISADEAKILRDWLKLDRNHRAVQLVGLLARAVDSEEAEAVIQLDGPRRAALCKSLRKAAEEGGLVEVLDGLVRLNTEICAPHLDDWEDAPVWLSKLAVGRWGAGEWESWERWRKALGERGVKPDMLDPVGDPARPGGIAAPGQRGWRSGTIDWDADDERVAVLNGIKRLVDALDRP